MTKQTLTTSLAVGSGLAVVALFFVAGGQLNMPGIPSSNSNQGAAANQVTQLVAQDETVGTGAEARVGDTLSVNYTGKLDDGTVFDTSVGKAPIQFVLGAGQVIQGWEQGLQGMKVGGKRLLIIPAALGYGSAGNGPIPPNANLVFEVELVGLTPQGQ